MGAFTAVSIKREYPGKKDTELYQAALLALPNAGYEIWKKRDLLTFVSGKGLYKGKEVYCEILVDIHGGKAKITARAQSLEEKDLSEMAESIGKELDIFVK